MSPLGPQRAAHREILQIVVWRVNHLRFFPIEGPYHLGRQPTAEKAVIGDDCALHERLAAVDKWLQVRREQFRKILVGIAAPAAPAILSGLGTCGRHPTRPLIEGTEYELHSQVSSNCLYRSMAYRRATIRLCACGAVPWIEGKEFWHCTFWDTTLDDNQRPAWCEVNP